MTINVIKPFVGEHCETTATGTLLRQLGIELSEPMLFGIGQGLCFIFWNMKGMDFPFMGGRVKTDLLTQNIARNLNLELIVKETSSKTKAWHDVKHLLDIGQTVGLKLDCFYLEYFANAFHFAGHYAAIYGYDDKKAFLVDTQQQGGQVSTSLASLALARAEKGPMASKNLYYTVKLNGKVPSLMTVVPTAIKLNALHYLNPPIKNIGYKGILKASTEVIKWFNASKNIEHEFSAAAVMMEKVGTGGALFRNLYRDFLKESYDLLNIKQLKTGYEAFAAIAQSWTAVAQLFEQVSLTHNARYIRQASGLLKEISVQEKAAMEVLAAV